MQRTISVKRQRFWLRNEVICTIHPAIWIIDGIRPPSTSSNKSLFIIYLLGHDKIVDLMIKNGADVDFPDNRNRTALHYAAFKGTHEYTTVVGFNKGCKSGVRTLTTSRFNDRRLNQTLPLSTFPFRKSIVVCMCFRQRANRRATTTKWSKSKRCGTGWKLCAAPSCYQR